MQNKVEIKRILSADIEPPRRVVMYIRFATEKQYESWTKITRKTSLSAAVEYNSRKFYQTADSTIRQCYEEKVKELVERINADRESAPRIIAETVYRQAILTERERVCGRSTSPKTDAMWRAIVTTLKSLIDIKKARA